VIVKVNQPLNKVDGCDCGTHRAWTGHYNIGWRPANPVCSTLCVQCWPAGRLHSLDDRLVPSIGRVVCCGIVPALSAPVWIVHVGVHVDENVADRVVYRGPTCGSCRRPAITCIDAEIRHDNVVSIA
jgi:hypothetical protein